MEPTAIVVVVLLLIGLAVPGVPLVRKRRSEHLQEHHGPGYDREPAGTGDDADRRTKDVPVPHPGSVQQYREARAVREATERGPVDTERQRHAVTSYRSLVEALPGKADAADPVTNGRHVPTREEHTR